MDLIEQAIGPFAAKQKWSLDVLGVNWEPDTQPQLLHFGNLPVRPFSDEHCPYWGWMIQPLATPKCLLHNLLRFPC
jgi:hypothetical protein